MPYHARSTSVTSRRHSLPSSLPPAPLALLDLTKPSERAMHDYLTRATTGRHPSLRLLDLRRVGPPLVCVVQWTHNKEPAVLEIASDAAGISLYFTPYLTTDLARAELNRRCADFDRPPS